MPAAWIKTGLTPQIMGLPGWVVLPLPFTLMNWASFWGWLPFLTLLTAAIWLKSKGRTIAWVVRKLKSKARGGKIVARGLGYRRLQSTEIAVWRFDFEAWRQM